MTAAALYAGPGPPGPPGLGDIAAPWPLPAPPGIVCPPGTGPCTLIAGIAGIVMLWIGPTGMGTPGPAATMGTAPEAGAPLAIAGTFPGTTPGADGVPVGATGAAFGAGATPPATTAAAVCGALAETAAA